MGDEALWTRACEGEHAAWVAVCRALHGRVHRFFARRVADDDVGDLTQQTMSAFITARPRLSPDTKVRGYVLGIACNLLAAHVRRRHQHAVGELELVSAHDLEPRPSTALRMRDDRRALLDALRHLPLAMQNLIELYYFEDLSTPQIAAMLEMPDNTVRSRLARARAALRTRVEGTPTALVNTELPTDDDDRWARSFAVELGLDEAVAAD